MIDFLNDFVSAFSGMLIILFSALVIHLYWDTARGIIRHKERKKAETWFSHGIVVGFTSISMNAFFWKVIGRFGQLVGAQTFTDFLRTYGGFFDLMFSIATVWAAYCHLYSAFLHLSVRDRDGWTWLTISFYPNHNFLSRAIHNLMSQVNPK